MKTMYHLRLVHGFFFMLWTVELFLPQLVPTELVPIFFSKLAPVMIVASLAIIIDVILKGYKNPEGTFFFWITFWLTMGIQMVSLYYMINAALKWLMNISFYVRYHPFIFQKLFF